ncbi:MAG: 3-hydroxybutyrate dehydrogenase [Limnobacter sp.]|jgi:3-hydroxybutyrate dehydrogenase|uniref:3-hydroxybutyrate dehydrogenase n=1 Tax=unclassified Limnobacter TaxID=2630203 RepID=UPI000C545176|nr:MULTISPECIES: 3-hydroxybutyrate dehydrogenase [unclassified Limnobacter]MAG79898.1 3-hydroxybutyrate dehydrogenase [Sutterellaceae bacterium]PZO13784.1 MAG: 3-hydroxybutyrate dehydrogenase [Betaproteobacteria bacterium]MBT82935.1 3-hydroxybutyrate dehydrogenase [Sutterellaceae bacterium]MDZ4049902.1 3-hydroxybutyrate dehydrogenase [Limnobacter sp.]PZO26717.1 MAG: 3-hydroxybutyrate dehydrogenase [Betaproteobacteria bacterium]|tara:strand:+ start:5612 stop:6379 length:768 start_codon:yes stop_codon:yes gene_type:complete
MNALVTGSTSGIGLGIAQRLAAKGVNVMLNGFGTPEQIEAAKQSVAAYGVKVGYHGADLTKVAEVEDLVKSTEQLFGQVDVLVNNAGIQHVSPVESFDPAKWDAVIAINLSAAFHTTRLVLPGMQARNWGRIVNIASAHGLVASANKSAYVAAKHGIVGLTKVVALENAKTGITCNAVCPGWVLTPLVQAQVDARAVREGVSVEEAKVGLLSEKQPSQEFVTPEQLGGLVVFLCSDDAQEVRGAAWNMDGGWVAQ